MNETSWHVLLSNRNRMIIYGAVRRARCLRNAADGAQHLSEHSTFMDKNMSDSSRTASRRVGTLSARR